MLSVSVMLFSKSIPVDLEERKRNLDDRPQDIDISATTNMNKVKFFIEPQENERDERTAVSNRIENTYLERSYRRMIDFGECGILVSNVF
jgi:hypothetical protein